MRRLLAVLLVLPLAVAAGCAAPEEAPHVPVTSAPIASTMAQERLAAAISALPDVVAVDGELYRGSAKLLTFNGSFGEAQGGHLVLEADPATLEALSGGRVSGGLLGSRIALHSTKQGDLFLRNATGFLFPGEARQGQLNPGASLREAPVGKVLDGGAYVRELLRGANVTRAEPTTHQGQAALQVVAEVPRDDKRAVVAVILVDERIARIETTLPTDPAAPGDPLAGATLVADVDHGARAAPERIQRASSLMHDSTASIFGGDPKRVAWTFLGTPRVPLAEAVALGRASNLDLLAGDPQAAALWTMPLSQKEATHDGVRVVFTDADGDGLVGAGDTLVATAEGDADVPHLLLSDATTGVVLLAISR